MVIGEVWYIVWCGMVLCGMVWLLCGSILSYGVVWSCMLCGIVCYGML